MADFGGIYSVGGPFHIIPLERNPILNPKHPAFIDVKLVETVPFFFDPRIFATGQSKRKRGKIA